MSKENQNIEVSTLDTREDPRVGDMSPGSLWRQWIMCDEDISFEDFCKMRGG